ncbi:MAG: DUF4010 domain-containing protein [Ignavibacteriae bacterium]|nr:MAG: DUF4010 domain-containing protein [Ignavibacteriota bacterium]
MDGLFTVTDLGPWITLGISLLIGLLIGAEREGANGTSKLGLRDVVLSAALGWMSARTAEPWLTVALIAAIMVILVTHRRDLPNRGVTTELAVLIVFGLSYAISGPTGGGMLPLAIALSIGITLLLDSKTAVKKFFHETLSEQEFADTVRFLALIFIIYPLLPEGRFGPYDFFAPRGLWLSVILVSGVSFVGYFLEKFIGGTIGTWLTALVGGLVSTTATTSAFAAQVKLDPSRMTAAWQAATLSNAVQFPRIFVLVSLVAPALASSFAIPAIAALVAGIVMAILIGMMRKNVSSPPVALENPLRLMPALKFAVYLAGVALISGIAYQMYGSGALYVTSAIGSLADVDAVTLNSADQFNRSLIDARMMNLLVFIAVLTNMIVKLGLALTEGNMAFMLRMAISFAVMLSAYLATILIF